MRDLSKIVSEKDTERFCQERAQVYKTKELFENKTDLKVVDEVFRVSTEEFMF